MLPPDRVTDPLNAYQLAKRGNVLRVMAQAVGGPSAEPGSTPSAPASSSLPWPATSSPAPAARDTGAMLCGSPAGRAGTPDEVATVAALLMGPDGAFITGSDILMDGGVTASCFYGDLAPL